MNGSHLTWQNQIHETKVKPTSPSEEQARAKNLNHSTSCPSKPPSRDNSSNSSLGSARSRHLSSIMPIGTRFLGPNYTNENNKLEIVPSVTRYRLNKNCLGTGRTKTIRYTFLICRHKPSLPFTCLCRTLSIPAVRPVSVFCVATGISNRSFTGGVSPLARALKHEVFLR